MSEFILCLCENQLCVCVSEKERVCVCVCVCVSGFVCVSVFVCTPSEPPAVVCKGSSASKALCYYSVSVTH